MCPWQTLSGCAPSVRKAYQDWLSPECRLDRPAWKCRGDAAIPMSSRPSAPTAPGYSHGIKDRLAIAVRSGLLKIDLTVKRFLASLLLIGALIGLFGAELAYARIVPATAPAKTMSMDSYFIAIMSMHQPS